MEILAVSASGSVSTAKETIPWHSLFPLLQWENCFFGWWMYVCWFLLLRWYDINVLLAPCVGSSVLLGEIHMVPWSGSVESATTTRHVSWGFRILQPEISRLPQIFRHHPRIYIYFHVVKSYNVGIAIINHPFLMVYTTHLWWFGGWFSIAIPTLPAIWTLNPRHWHWGQGIAGSVAPFEQCSKPLLMILADYTTKIYPRHFGSFWNIIIH